MGAYRLVEHPFVPVADVRATAYAFFIVVDHEPERQRILREALEQLSTDRRECEPILSHIGRDG